MIPREVVATALGLPPDTDALPPGDMPPERFAKRLIGYLSTAGADGVTPDAWTGSVMDHLIEERPDTALDVLAAGAGQDGGAVLADPLADLAQAGHADVIALRAAEHPALAALIDAANAT